MSNQEVLNQVKELNQRAAELMNRVSTKNRKKSNPRVRFNLPRELNGNILIRHVREVKPPKIKIQLAAEKQMFFREILESIGFIQEKKYNRLCKAFKHEEATYEEFAQYYKYWKYIHSRRIATVVAYINEGNIVIGYSMCNTKEDIFNKAKGIYRAMKNENTVTFDLKKTDNVLAALNEGRIPHTIAPAVRQIVIRASKVLVPKLPPVK